MSAAELVGKAVILSGLSLDSRKTMRASTRMPPRVGMVIRAEDDGRIRVKLWAGFGRRWAQCGRTCELVNVVRLATAREAAIGMVTT